MKYQDQRSMQIAKRIEFWSYFMH